MKAMPKISEAEFVVMKVVWEKNPITANEIVSRLQDSSDWNPKTIKTFISRLLKKGAIKYKCVDKAYFYTPAIPKEECQAEEAESFLNRVFDGALMPMLAHFAKSRNLSEAEITALKDILTQEN